MSYKDNINLRLYNAKNVGNLKKTNRQIAREEGEENVSQNLELLERCRRAWESLSEFRVRRKKMVRYYWNDQWHEKIKHPETGKFVREDEYMKEKGKIPFVQNIVRQIIKNLIGQYRNNPSKSIVVARSKEDAEASEMMTNALQAVKQINVAKELDARNYEEKLISGANISKTTWDYWSNRQIYDVFMENINPEKLFFNTDITDIRVDHNLYLVGEIHDLTIDEAVSAFAENKNDEKRIRDLYNSRDLRHVFMQNGLEQELSSHDFYVPELPHKCRVIEVWEKKSEWRTFEHDYSDGSFKTTYRSLEEVDQINEDRVDDGIERGYDPEEVPLIDAWNEHHHYWEVKFLTPFGNLLLKKKEPYIHGEHPYSIGLYPLIDGRVWGLIEDIKGQQRYINRLIGLLDFIMGAAAKGVLLVPEEAIPEGWNMDDYAEEWSKFDGVVKIKAKKGVQLPQQISTNATNIGAHEMLSLQMQLIQEISGVSGAMQGHTAESGKPASLYAQEAQNSSVNSLDFLESFQAWQQKRDMKIIKTIKQFYKEKRYLAISGQRYTEEAKMFDPEKIRNLEFDVSVIKGTDSPVYRQMIDETLMQLLEGQYIDLEMFLENTNMPFASQLMDTLQKRKQQMQQGKAPQGQAISPEMLQQMNQQINQNKGEVEKQANPQAMQMIQNAVDRTKKEAQKEPQQMQE